MITTIIIVILSYLIGSVSAAILLCKILHLPNPRKIGSKNPGATNIARINKNIGIYVASFDILKGIIPVWIGYLFNIPSFWLGVISIMATLGHIYPIFFKFQGGKGAATTLGSTTIMGWDITLIIICTWISILLVSGYSSLATIATAIIIPFYVWYFKSQFLLHIIILSILIIIKHYENIKRLYKGKEDKTWI